MKRNISWLLSAALLFCFSVAYARITGTPPSSSDTWCEGPDGAEVCVDANGNVIPTTDNDTTLGTSSLRWATGYIMDITVGDDLTVTDALTVDGNTTLGNASTDNITLNGAATSYATIAISSAAAGSGGVPVRFRGGYTSTEIGLLRAFPGDVVFNTTLFSLCPSTTTSAGGTVGAFVHQSSFTAMGSGVKVPCYQ